MYEKLLNNLLQIGPRDSSIKTTVNNTSIFDCMDKLSESSIQKIIDNKSFEAKITDENLMNSIKDLYEAQTPEDIIAIYKFSKIRLSKSKIDLLNADFKSTKATLVDELEMKYAKADQNWSRVSNKVKDYFERENTHQFFIGAFFIKVKMDSSVIHAPLLVRTAFLENKSGWYLTSPGEWELNEKLIFTLSQRFTNFKIKSNIKDMPLRVASKLVLTALGYKAKDMMSYIKKPFINLPSREITNLTPEITSGIIFGRMSPMGSSLKEALEKIIEDDKLDDIVPSEFHKRERREVIETSIIKSENIARIQMSNFSQDKAIISSLNHNTVIWGPPGTGKSQVIANIMANILAKGKTAGVFTQKKVALDVLIKRMGSLSAYCLFLINDSDSRKEEFYEPLQRFVEKFEVEYLSSGILGSPVVNSKAFQFISKQNISKRSFDKIMTAYQSLKKSMSKSEVINQLELLSKANFALDITGIEKYTNKSIALKNQVKKKGFLFFKWWPKSIKISTKTFRILQKKFSMLEIIAISDILKDVNFDDFRKIMNYDFNFMNQTQNFKSDVDEIEYIVSSKIISKYEKLEVGKVGDDELNKAHFNSFINACRAGRAIPYKFVAKHKRVMKYIFDVILATPNNNFVDWINDKFDYVIIDEASQVFTEVGIPMLKTGEIKIVAGDQKQLKPSRWFAKRDDSDMDDVEEGAESILDYVKNKGTYEVMLDENYRSIRAGLMSFSSKHYYDNKLNVATKNGIDDEAYDVINVEGTWEKGVNFIEATKVIKELTKIANQYDTFIILAFNRKQKELIEQLIYDTSKIGQKLLADNKLILRNIENIQGDEADVVIASVTYTPETRMGATYVTRKGGSNALNVAISRAKEKLVVVKSISSTTIGNGKTEDYHVFKSWLFFLDLKNDQKKIYSMQSNDIVEGSGEVESGFESNVLDVLLLNLRHPKKLKIIKQFEVGSRKIDLAILEEDTNQFLLGVEVDGHRYHLGKGYNQYAKDVSRQKYIESKGYPIFRVTEVDWNLHQDELIIEINRRINRY